MASQSFVPATPPKFDGQNYSIWSIKMKAYLQAFGLWDVMEKDYEVEELRANATQAQRLAHEDE